MGRDGCIYALANGGVLKIDTVNNSLCFVGNRIESDHDDFWGWGNAILGIEGCIYWTPPNSSVGCALKYDPHLNQTSLIGRDNGGALATDGIIFCISHGAKQVLTIDPLGEFSLVTKTKMEEHPEELGFLFRINDTDTTSNRTYFDCAVTNFGIRKVLEIVQEHEVYGLYPFMIAASCMESPLSVVYLLVRQVPFLIKTKSNSGVGNTSNLKIRVPLLIRILKQYIISL